MEIFSTRHLELRRDIPFPVELLADQVIYYLQINHYAIYKAFNKLPSSARRQLLNSMTTQMVAFAIVRLRDVFGDLPEESEECVDPPIL